MTNDYYVYIYYRLDTNEIFYVGKGKENRWKQIDDYHRSKHFIRIVNKHPVTCEIVMDNLTEEQAHGIECWIINELVFEYGYSINIPNNRSSEKGCHLINCTWGGDGTSGMNPFEFVNEEKREEWKSKIGKANRGENNPNYGKHHSRETKEKISEKLIGENNVKSRRIICITTNRIFGSIRRAEEYYNIAHGGISKCCRGEGYSYAGKLPDGTPLVWRYLEVIEL